ncbi:glycosyltransferase family 2 protein [Wenyingzhuangia sp. IMCC45533]
MTDNLISIIIPCYNQAEFLNETCDSLKSQSYPHWEAIIINDGSTDDTNILSKEICRHDNRFRYIEQENKGLSAARNVGINICDGEYILFLDSDDLITTDKLEKSIFFFRNEKSDIVISNFLRFNSKNKKEKKSRFNLNDYTLDFNSILLKWDLSFTIPIHCAIFSKEIIGSVRFNENLRAKEDWLFWINITKKNPLIFFYDRKDALYRAHNNNMSKNDPLMFKNNQIANIYIYDSIETNQKREFFNRINNELTTQRKKFLAFKQNSFPRVILHRLKKALKFVFNSY